ncbi:motility associated factor glycosyltransferase family protein [Desulfitobacterium sp. AusDCA]|uniref:motility associated factor glycosyltransferase family protein n=1 Tax=Desulfitobacterium sp. AusDCA TaxID=3240383 RepID=UPI003DA75AA7
MSEELLKRNLETIIQNNPFHLDELISHNFSEIGDGVIARTGTDGVQKVYFRQGNQELLLHSGYDPEAEAERIIGTVEPTRDYLFIVFGIGLGYHLFALKDKISPETRVVIMEPNLDVFKYALNHTDLTEIFASGQFLLIFGDQKRVNKMVTSIASLGYYKLIHNAKVLMLPNYYVYANQNREVVKQIHKVLLNTVISFGNDLEDQFLGFSNICKNTDAIMNSYSFESFKGKYTDVPAIIVASGPSLDKNIHFLKNANGKALIITCDASMRACEKNGVQPDAIASIERVEATYKFYYKGRTFPEDLVLLAPGTVWPNVCAEYPGKVVLVSRNSTGFENIWMSNFDHFRFESVGHSCATLAFTAAREAGCNPIILIGQDLAYTSGKAHSNLTHTYEFEGANDDRNADDIYVEDYKGNLLKSSFVFNFFKEWYEIQIASYQKIDVIDATEGGAYIKGTTLMTLEEAIYRYCQKPIEKHMVEYLPDKRISLQKKLKKYETLLKSMDHDMKDLERIKKEANSHMKRLRGIEKNLKPDSSTNQLISYVQKMKQGDKVTQRIKRSAPLESYYSPIIMQTVTQVKGIGNELSLENVRRNLLLQYNLMFMIANSTDLIIKEYLNSKEILEQKYGELKDDK